MNWFERVPKAELHFHLEGAIPLPALWELVQKYDTAKSVAGLEVIIEKFQYRDFPHFIETWIWKNHFLREYEDFSFIAEAVARDLAAQNIRYVEAFYSPSDFRHQGLEIQGISEAIRKGLNKVPEVEIMLVPDLVRDLPPETGFETLLLVNEVRDLGIIGVGIGGSEQAFPPEPFAEVYEKARELGFRTSAHAGEAAGAESVWGAIRSLRVDRIGHGTRATEDPALLDYLAEKQIPVEMNPISNLRTGVIKSLEEHPARRFFDKGIPISINTDDPKMFNNSLAEEYQMLVEKQNFSLSEIQTLILNALKTSWLTEERKKAYIESFGNDPNWNFAD
jgi:adenosine deaminase